jgi:hypothetical protein
MIDWQFYPQSKRAPELLLGVVEVFERNYPAIASSKHDLKSNEVLAFLRDGLKKLDFEVEVGAKIGEAVPVPVLFGRRGQVAKHFKADAFHRSGGVVLEVEAGRGVVNNQFLKDLFQACMMGDAKYLVTAVRLSYRGQPDFKRVITFFDTLYASGRLQLPLDGVLIIGY